MGAWIGGYVATGLVFLGLDTIWLGWAAGRLYRPRLGPLLREDYALAPAAAFYLLYIAGIMLFAVAPALESGRWTTALARGAGLGLIAYATYDLTNQATLRGWSATVTAADLCWGSFVTAVAATAGCLVMRWIAARG